jgi:DNA replicative helicase MCM subunit Mcm2 (Cdc46/Mcm family)
MTTAEIKTEADKAGLDTKNISQTLAYLKRQGRLVSPRRGVYQRP